MPSTSSRNRQTGAGLLAFALVVSVIAFAFVLGSGSLLVKRQANTLAVLQAARVKQAAESVTAYWASNAVALDYASDAALPAAQDVLAASGVPSHFKLLATWSRQAQGQAVGSDDKLLYRSLVIYVVTSTDDTNAPDLAAFAASGTFVSCPVAGQPCAARAYEIVSGLQIERKLLQTTQDRLSKSVQKAQAYFKARMLQDPERNVSVNYFRKPLGGCNTISSDLGCLDVYTPLSGLVAPGQVSLSPAGQALGLSLDESFTGWGAPLELSNLLDSTTDDTPFTLSVRAPLPNGTYLRMSAVQPY